MFERYLVVVMEGLRRVTTRLKVDDIGFGEDIAFKSGTLMSPSMFRKLILPRYKKAMDFAHGKAIDLTWYDSDGDLRPFAPDYLSVGINGLAPCEVAAGMAPTELRRRFGRDLRLIGGLDKREVAKGRRAIDAELERNQPVIAEGGYMPAIDHSVSADISFGDYCYFVEALQRALDV
jgi:uroporphyrinogen decarboxylase